MIGVTATAGAVIYYGHGVLVPGLAAAAVVGVQVGSFFGMRASGPDRQPVAAAAAGDRAVRRGDRDVRGGAMSADDARRTELALGRVLTVGTRVSTACLAAGLVLTFVVPGARMTGILLAVGLMVLMATPVARVAVSIAEFARQARLEIRDLRVHCLCAADREFGGGAAVSRHCFGAVRRN